MPLISPSHFPRCRPTAALLLLCLAGTAGFCVAADPPIPAAADYEALTTALKLRQTDLARQILARNPALASTPPAALPNASNRGSFWGGVPTPLFTAAGLSETDLVALLLQLGAKVDTGYWLPPRSGTVSGDLSPLSTAVRGARAIGDIVREQHGLAVKAPPPDEAQLQQQADTIELLLAHGAKADGMLYQGDTGHMALSDYVTGFSTPRILEAFLRHHALDRKILFPVSPLAVAAAKGDLVRLRLFLTYLPDVFDGELSRRALVIALTGGQDEAARLLRAQHLPLDVLTFTVTGDLAALARSIDRRPELLNYHDALCNCSLLAWAVAIRQPAIAEWLLARGAPVNPPIETMAYDSYLSGDLTPSITDWRKNCSVPLYLALGMDPRLLPPVAPRSGARLDALQPDARLVHLLLEKGANPNVADVQRITPLGFVLASVTDPQIAADLLAHGADPNRPSGPHQQTPLELARDRPPEFAALLVQHGAIAPASRPPAN